LAVQRVRVDDVVAEGDDLLIAGQLGGQVTMAGSA